jgi:hypothetical protein
MTEVNGTIILTDEDLINGKESSRPSVFDFKLNINQINRASNIIYARPMGSLVFFKIRKTENFLNDNSWILKTKIDLIR